MFGEIMRQGYRPIDDSRFMDRALTLAARLPRRPWPNPPVGAVVVGADGAIVGEGAHFGPGERHAERVALDRAGERARGGTLYVSLEPCNHEGRTPACAPHVAASGVRRVVVAVADPNPRVAGGGVHLLRERGLEVVLGVGARAALELIWPFVATDAFSRPYLELKLATTMDARFAPPHAATGNGPVYLTGEAARRDVHRRRRWMDLVLVGSGTARADRPRLDARLAPADAPLPAADPAAGYVDTELSLAEGPRRERGFVFHRRGARPGTGGIPSGFTPVPCPEREGRLDPAGLLAAAAGHGLHTLMLEGGPRLAASFLAAGRVDTWVQYLAPAVLGGGVSWPPAFSGRPDAIDPGIGGSGPGDRWHLRDVRRLGADARLIWDRRDFATDLQRLTAECARAARVACAVREES
ncbi:MAG: bifunctional diaminohydroxyphosphoribosylaminopyrimidine deaminase/5-amino-6-(5-phosphoribosylamino)uracil reductase RibD [Candidatus Krumholzibacteriia bacterium]